MEPADINSDSVAETRTWWKDEEVSLMLSIISDLNVAPVLNSKSQRNAAVFNAVAQRMKSKGYQRTGEQVRNKWKNMKKEYYSLKKKGDNVQQLRIAQPKYFQEFEILLQGGTADANVRIDFPAVTDPRSVLECVINSPSAEPSEDGDERLSECSSSSISSEDTTTTFDQQEAGSFKQKSAPSHPAVSTSRHDLPTTRRKRQHSHSYERALSHYHKLYTDFTQKLWTQHQQWEIEERRQRNQETIQLAQGLVQALLPLLAQTRDVTQPTENLPKTLQKICQYCHQAKPQLQEPSSSFSGANESQEENVSHSTQIA